MAKKRIPSLNADPRYYRLLKMYSGNWPLAMYAFFDKHPDPQQREIIDVMYQPNCRLSVKSGHGTGKSDLASMVIIMFMIFNPRCRVVIIAAKIAVVKDAIWSNLSANFNTLKKRLPWVAHYFELTDSMFYERSKKLEWSVDCKGYQVNNEQTLAGEHRDYMLTIIDEASVVTDAAFKTVLGAQTSKDNRVVLFSQPTRVGGFFYETHHGLRKEEGGRWTSITLRSDYSKWVQPDFILSSLSDYGGFDSPEFQIKVLGRFPQKSSEFLLGRLEAQRAVEAKVELDEDWGWVAACDVGVTRDRSVINMCKVSGAIGHDRVVKNRQLLEMPADVQPVAFASKIVAMCCDGQHPNITIVIDIDGVGYPVWELVVAAVAAEGHSDVTVVGLRWGKPPFSDQQKKRFKNLRSMAHVYACEAIKDNRMSIDRQPKTVDQFSKLPCIINASGQWVMLSKKEMKSRYQLSSPDRSDTYCFTQIVNYVPANEASDDLDDEASLFNKFLESEQWHDSDISHTKGDLFDASGDGWAAADAFRDEDLASYEEWEGS